MTLSSHDWMAETEVTQGQWEAVMGSNPSSFDRGRVGADTMRHPVERVSWDDAQGFVEKLNEVTELPEGWKWALPTEAQWERAARGGRSGPYGGTGNLDEMGWYSGNSGGQTRPVKGKAANDYGLYDMHGNVWEWCLDAWDGTRALPSGVDPVGREGVFRVIRGGSWSDRLAAFCRAASRGRFVPGFRLDGLGFRPALVPSGRGER